MASGAIKGITIEFRGDTTKLGKALNDVNKEIRTTDSALREVDKALKLDPSNVELLAQKEELLNKQIEQTKDKLELQKTAAKEAAQALEEGTITKEEYAKLTAEVATTANKLGELEGQASGAAEEMKETGNAAQEAGQKASESKESFIDWGSVVSSAADMAITALAAVADTVREVAGAMVDMTVETAGYADEILTLSSVSGVSTDTLQALQYGEEQLDVSVGTVTGAITKLIKAMGNAQDSEQDWQDQVDELNAALESGQITAEDYQEAITDLGTSGTAFSDLGIDILDAQGNLRDSEEVFWEVIDALGNIENATERDAVAMDLLGRSAMQLNPLIEAGSEGFREIYEQAEEAGAIMEDDTLDSFDEFNDTLSRLSQGTSAAKRAIGAILLPTLSNMATDGVSLLNDFTNAVLNTDGDLDELGTVIDEMASQVIEFLDEWLPEIISVGSSIISSLAEGILSNLPELIAGAVQIIEAIAQGIINSLSDLAPVVADIVVNFIRFLTDNLPTIITAAADIIIAITRGLAEAMPELIPAVVDCVLLICETLLGPECLPQLILAAQELIMGIIEGLIRATPDILAAIPPLVQAIIESFNELGPALVDNAYDWGYDMIISLINGMEDMLPALASGAAGVAGTLAAYLHHTTPDKGPLKDDDKWGSDFIDNFIQGMDSEDLALERSLYGVANTIYNGMDYTSQLAGISSQLAGIGVGGIMQPINVYIGSQRVATVVANANAENNYRTGGL